MTRLSHKDIDTITSDLAQYNNQLIASTGSGLFDIACCCHGCDPVLLSQKAETFSMQVIPVTAGIGVITEFSETVAGILRFLGFKAEVAPFADVTGLAHAVDNKVDGVFLADDATFMALHSGTFSRLDNSIVTGQMYATVLDMMGRAFPELGALVIGCGPVGCCAAAHLLGLGRRVALFDVNMSSAKKAQHKLLLDFVGSEDLSKSLDVITDLERGVQEYDLILEATPAEAVLQDSWITPSKKVAMPGVPLGLSEYGAQILGTNLVHDKLELGVAGMAVGLLNIAITKSRL